MHAPPFFFTPEYQSIHTALSFNSKISSDLQGGVLGEEARTKALGHTRPPCFVGPLSILA